jgi:hypothetical protein
MRRVTSVHSQNAFGFTLLEFLTVFATFLVLIAGVFSEIAKLQQVYKGEETKVDASQESRTMLDEIAREVHQSGYPGQSLFDPSALTHATVLNNQAVAAGLVKISNYELWFEGDVDGDGVVDVMHYMLMDNNGNPVTAASNCPCTLQRSQVQKADNTAPLAQASTYNSGLSNVLNSGGVGANGASLTISGTTNGTSNDTLYTAYKSQNVFTPLDQTGKAITTLPIDITNPVAISSVKSIVITVNTTALSTDLQTKMQMPFTATVTAKLNN